MSVVDDLRRELAELRAEFDAYRKQMAAEVRTGRLVVIDDAGVERIDTVVSSDITVLDVTGPADEFGDRGRVSLRADLGESTHKRGRETNKASVTCSGGSDGFAHLEHVALASDNNQYRYGLAELFLANKKGWRFKDEDHWRTSGRDFRLTDIGLFEQSLDGDVSRAQFVREQQGL